MSGFEFDPATYLEEIRADIPVFEELQDEVAAATRGIDATRILELGTGTGETARRVLAVHPDAQLVGVDASEAMVAAAARTLDADLRVARLQDPLPDGPFDLVFSALAVHHLDPDEKRDLFARVADVLGQRGRFVLGDVVLPERPENALIPLTPGFDLPDAVPDLLAWLRDAGLDAAVTWSRNDLAVIQADRRG